MSGPVLPVLRLSALSGVVPVLLVSGVASVGSPAPGPVVILGPVLVGEFTLLASLAAGFAPPQPMLADPHRTKSTATLDRIMTRFLLLPAAWQQALEPVHALCQRFPAKFQRIWTPISAHAPHSESIRHASRTDGHEARHSATEPSAPQLERARAPR